MPLAFPDLPPVRLDGEGRIREGLPCPSCGYDLRGQAAGGACPECGKPIRVRALENGLAVPDESPAHAAWRAGVEAAPAWLGRGVLWLAAGVLPGLVMVTRGVWGMTAKEPPGVGVPREGQAAFFARVCARWFTALMCVGVPAAFVFAAWMLYSRRGVGGDGWRLVDAVVSGTVLTYLVGLMFGWRHLFDLVARADKPDASLRLKRLWRTYFNAILMLTLVAVAVVVGDQFIDRSASFAGQPLEHVALGAAAVAVLGVAAWVWWRTASVLRGLRFGETPLPGGVAAG